MTILAERKLSEFEDAIRSLPKTGRLEKKDLLTKRFCIWFEDELEIFYAPVGLVNRRADVALVGLTPGWHQMQIAFEVARKHLSAGSQTVLNEVSKEAAFAGYMRSNLVKMLDSIGVPKTLRVSDAIDLFGSERRRVHTTSVLRYPVFFRRSNYTGHRPALRRTPLLLDIVEDIFIHEIRQIKTAVVIPLGKPASETVEHLVQHGSIKRSRCILGIPHPSGTNAHGPRQFRERKDDLRRQTQRWAKWKAKHTA